MLTASDVTLAFLTWKKNIVCSKWLAQLKTRPARMITFSSDPSAPHSDMRCCLIMVTSPSVFTPVKNSLVTTATLEIRCNWQVVKFAYTGWFSWLFPPNFSTKKKTANQPITAAVPVNLANKKGCDWLIGSFLFGTEIGWEQLKNHPVNLISRRLQCFTLVPFSQWVPYFHHLHKVQMCTSFTTFTYQSIFMLINVPVFIILILVFHEVRRHCKEDFWDQQALGVLGVIHWKKLLTHPFTSHSPYQHR